MTKISRIGKQKHLLPSGDKVWLSPDAQIIDAYKASKPYKAMWDKAIKDAVESVCSRHEEPDAERCEVVFTLCKDWSYSRLAAVPSERRDAFYADIDEALGKIKIGSVRLRERR